MTTELRNLAILALALATACGGPEKESETPRPTEPTGPAAGASPGDAAAPAASEPEDEEEPAETEPKPNGAAEAAPGDEEASLTGIEACDEYIALVEIYIECEAIPEKAREAQRKGVEHAKEAWKRHRNDRSEGVKKQTAAGCRQAIEGLTRAAEAAGCPFEGREPVEGDGEAAGSAEETGFDVIVDPAGSVTYLDGRRIGATPLAVRRVAPGEHDLRIERAGYATHRQKVVVKEGEVLRIVVDLEKCEGEGCPD